MLQERLPIKAEMGVEGGIGGRSCTKPAPDDR